MRLAGSPELSERDHASVPRHVRQNQGEREEEEAQQEVPEETVALAAGDSGGPERDGDPDDQTNDSHTEPHFLLLYWCFVLAPEELKTKATVQDCFADVGSF
jgi:hypothetical protein